MSLRLGARLFSAGLIVALFLVAGCKSKESMIPGTWSAQGLSITAKADKTFSGATGPAKISGTWSMDGDDAVFKPELVNGQPIAKLKAAAEAQAGALPASMKASIDDMDKSNFMKLSDDGKTMTTDKAKDKNSGPAMTFTKTP